MSTIDKAHQSERINLRIDPTVKANLLEAAAISGRNLTDFVLSAAIASAHTVLSDRTSFVLSPKDWSKFNSLLDSPPREIPHLKRLFKEKSVFEKQ